MILVDGRNGKVRIAKPPTTLDNQAHGLIAAAYTAKGAGLRNLVTYDMGGPSTDVALIRDAEPAVSSEMVP